MIFSFHRISNDELVPIVVCLPLELCKLLSRITFFRSLLKIIFEKSWDNHITHIWILFDSDGGLFPDLLGIKGKLAPRYIGPFEIIETCGPVAYRLRLPSQLAAIHDVFHVSQLRKCIKVPTEILEPQDIEIESDLSYTEYPIKILDTKERSTRREKVKMYKIQWRGFIHHITNSSPEKLNLYIFFSFW